MRTVVLDGRSLTSEAVLAVAESRAKVECAPDALERVRLARAAVEGIIARGEVVYGINTGFGKLYGRLFNISPGRRFWISIIIISGD